MLIIDCGACIGAFFRNFLDHEIHAFEPLNKNYKYICKRYPNVIAHRKAVTGRSGDMIKLFLHEDPKHRNRLGSQGSSVNADKTNVVSEHFEEVESIALSDYIKSLGQRVNLLKIDTEGTEFEIFADLLESDCLNEIDMIMYEDHRDRHPQMFDLPWTQEIEARVRKEFKGELKVVDF